VPQLGTTGQNDNGSDRQRLSRPEGRGEVTHQMMKTIRRFRSGFDGLQTNDERGAESSEVILVLVLLVIGLLGAWAFLRDRIGTQASRTGSCISGANTATTC
jgi:hypothetical protein